MPALQETDEEWCTKYVAASTKSIPVSGGHVLGIDFKGATHVSTQFTDAANEVASLHSNLAQVEDVATEVVLMRACADVCKVVHFLRAAGGDIATDALDKYDNILQGSLQRLLGGPLDDTTILQASLGVHEGGIGLRG